MCKVVLILSIIISFAAGLIFCIYMNKSRKKQNIKGSKISGFYVYIMSMWVMNISLLLKINELGGKNQLILSIIPIVMSLLLLYLKQVLVEIIAKESVDLEYEFLVRKRENDERYYNLMKEYVNRLSVMRHDFMHQIQLAYIMVENNNNSSKSIELLDGMSEELQATRPVMYCSNKMVNIILTMKIREMTKRNIKADMDIILPGTLNIEERIMCNIINGMIDECMEIKDLDESKECISKMSFRMKKKGNRIVLTMSTDISGIKDMEKYKNVRKYYDRYLIYIVEQCDGDVKYVEEAQTLSTIVAMDNVSSAGGNMSYA